MKSLKAISGKHAGEVFTIESDKLFSGFVRGVEIPFCEILSIEKTETIKKEVFVKISLSDGGQFDASMKEDSYQDCYKKFLELGNKPKYNLSSEKKTSASNAFWGVLGFLFLFVIFLRDESADNTIALTDKNKVELCKAYIGSIFGKNTSIIRHYKTEDGIYYVKYTRSMDNTEWRYACDITGNIMVWTGWIDDKKDWGRWRYEDEVKINISEDRKNLFFTLKDTGKKVVVKY